MSACQFYKFLSLTLQRTSGLSRLHVRRSLASPAIDEAAAGCASPRHPNLTALKGAGILIESEMDSAKPARVVDVVREIVTRLVRRPW